MTDTIETSSMGTQTLIPRLPKDAFLEACATPAGLSDPKLLQQCSEMERNLLKQLAKIRKTVTPLTAQYERREDEQRENESPTDSDTVKTNDTIKSMDGEIPFESNNTPFCTKYRSSLLKPTHLSWYFEYDNDFSCANKFHPYTISANKPWNSFRPVAFGPTCSTDFSFLLLAIDELIKESNCLADRIDEMYKRRQQQTASFLENKEEDKELFDIAYKSPSEYWLPIIEEQERALAEFKTLKGVDTKNLEKCDEKME